MRTDAATGSTSAEDFLKLQDGASQFVPDRSWIENIARYDEAEHARLLMVLGSHFDTVGVLGHKMIHLVWLATDLVASHLMPYGAEVHLHSALGWGATMTDVLETLDIAATVGHRSLDMALPMIDDELAAAGAPDPSPADAKHDTETARLLDEAQRVFGEIPTWVTPMLVANPAFVRAVLGLEFGNTEASLSDKEKALIRLGVFSCPAVADPDQTRRAVRQAIAFGATREELTATVQISSGIALHTYTVAVPLLVAATELRKTP